MMTYVRLTLAVILAVYAVMFVYNNTEQVQIVLPLLARGQVQGWLAFLIAGVLGALVSGLLLSLPMVRLRSQSRREIKRISQLERELHGLRTLPLEATRRQPIEVPPPEA